MARCFASAYTPSGRARWQFSLAHATFRQRHLPSIQVYSEAIDQSLGGAGGWGFDFRRAGEAAAKAGMGRLEVDAEVDEEDVEEEAQEDGS